jgi:hypothetical protein
MGFVLMVRGLGSFGCSERELGEGFGFGDPGSVVARVRLVVVYIFRRDRSDALRLGSHGDGGLSMATNSFFEVFLHHDGEREFLLKKKTLV